ncbi:NAD-dependent epimerase/dehydratase family protein [uncultured Thomasclavelia sp.]|uniref:NAD-dependent epimerase/dehydratase family protein n=1 Tax=uncultured Thomasclavelia sp. TaxID=3025759 RepID=UPI0025F50D29|nr:NAD-dependent epimerase/dehydratase family protein [uncultured Thomasclavelia sp.]
MKKILITGANSYIGTSFEKYIEENHQDDYHIDTLDMINPNWKKCDFSGYDSIFHVAGIAHIKETKNNAHLYYEINRDLAIKVAKKAKQSKVHQFVFMSSMSVYGLDYSNDYITLDTPTNPKTNYGKSKLQAEKEILKLNDDNFKVCVLRPPMVYGDKSPGNLTKLYKLVRKIHVFPTIKNQRSAISVEKLCMEVEKAICLDTKGILLPQNDKYMCTFEIVKNQMQLEDINVIYIALFNQIIRLLIGKVGVITKCFGNLVYEKK